MMKDTLSSSLSEERLAELLQLSKLELNEDETILDKSYLEAMIRSAAKIDAIEADHLPPATHAYDVAQRLREDHVTDTEDSIAYQQLAPAMTGALYSVPAVIE